MSSDRFEFTKENIDTYLKELAKEYHRRHSRYNQIVLGKQHLCTKN